MNPFHLLALAVLGAAAGLLGTLLGLGGALLITPLLTLFFGVPIEIAIATSLISIIGTSSAAASVYVEQKLSDIRLGMFLELGTTVGAVSGAFVAGMLSRRLLTMLFSAFLLYAGSSMIRRAMGRGRIPEADTANYQVKHRGWGLLVSYVAGGISGLLGVGGGPVKVPLMYLIMGVPLRVATATSNFMIGVTAAASAFVYYQRGNVQVFPTAPVVVGVFIGSLAGTRVSRHVPTRMVLWLFVGVTFYMALTMAYKALRMGG